MKIIYFQEHCITPHPLNYRVNIFNTDLDGHRLFLLVEGKKLEEMLGAPLLQGEHVNWKANSEAYTWCGSSSTQTSAAGTWKSRQQAHNARRGRCWEAQQHTHPTTQQLLTSFQDQGANNRIRLMPYKLAEHLQNRQISASTAQITPTTPHFLSPYRDFCNPNPSQRGTEAGGRAQLQQTEPGGLFKACFVNLKAILSSWSLTAA